MQPWIPRRLSAEAILAAVLALGRAFAPPVVLPRLDTPDPKPGPRRRGRVYGGRSKGYYGPRLAGRRRPDPAKLCRRWRQRKAVGS